MLLAWVDRDHDYRPGELEEGKENAYPRIEVVKELHIQESAPLLIEETRTIFGGPFSPLLMLSMLSRKLSSCRASAASIHGPAKMPKESFIPYRL